ncbi:MHO_1590 family protein [[Mycoplasma] gypis]|uniref:Uncharacterized protein n=1 Tax=[Mycoplasma] gypis TaxID=92404 RepID=A0ABZ2RNT7_9BACT|nr:hypothetical protein [[Mycoplasma] gypis]MBN0919314.1 hypothetical protein [[Mycoplasma] gypis]
MTLKTKLIKNKRNIAAFIVTIVIAAIVATGLYAFLPWNKVKTVKKIDDSKTQISPKKPKTPEKSSDLITSENIFPSVQISDYYSLIRVENNVPVINNDMIAYIIQDIIKRLSVNYGDIDVGYFQPTKQQLEIKFIWKFEGTKVLKNYSFKITYEV